MPGQRRNTVLISEPNAIDDMPYLPYMWATLKSYHERHGAAVDLYEWLDPIYERGEPSSLLEPYRGTRIDVLGLSCYTWNWEIQRRIAERVKAENPDCRVVAGGPEPAYKDPRFFIEHPYVDVVVVNDGEIPFARILDALAEDRGAPLRSIPGLYLPDEATREPNGTGPPEVPGLFDHSPYVDQSAFFERLVKSRGPGALNAVWETNRGCPYSCSFCDWGSNTMSKVRRFDLERVRAEVEWLARMGTKVILITDANLGILPRDLEIADYLCSARAKYGYPKAIYYSAAKNNPDRSIEIAGKFAAAGLIDCHFMAVQHTREEVLAATERQNISPQKQKEVAKALQGQTIPITVQLIVGIPGDTLDLWRTCFSDLMEWGIHEDYQVFPYCLLPNAPAAEESFRRRWEIETAVCAVTTQHLMPRSFEEDHLLTGEVIIKSRTYTRGDWTRMNAYAAFIRTFHTRCLTRWISLYLRHAHGVTYRDFYDDLIDGFLTAAPAQRRLLDAVHRHCEDAVAQKCGFDQMVTEQLPSYRFYLSMSQWAFVQIALEFDDFWRALESHLLLRYPGVAALTDLINYQQNLVVLPSYDREAGKSFGVEYDWPEYFERVSRQDGPGFVEGPRPTPGAQVVVADTVGGPFHEIPFDWDSLMGEGRWIQWIRRTVAFRGCAAKNNHSRVRIRRRSDAPTRRPLRVLY